MPGGLSASYVVQPLREYEADGWHSTGSYSMVKAAGELRRAYTANGTYLFSEAGAGIHPIVLLGHPSQLRKWLEDNHSREIRNKIGDLPNIYMSVCKYVADERKVVAPIGDAVQNIVGFMTNLLPSSMLADVVGNVADMIEYGSGKKSKISSFFGFKSGKKSQELKPADVQETDLLYVRIHYLKEGCAVKIGERGTTFAVVYGQLTGLGLI